MHFYIITSTPCILIYGWSSSSLLVVSLHVMMWKKENKISVKNRENKEYTIMFELMLPCDFSEAQSSIHKSCIYGCLYVMNNFME